MTSTYGKAVNGIKKGILYFQHQDRVEMISDINNPISFKAVNGVDSKPLSLLVAQVYQYQNLIFMRYDVVAEDKQLLAEFKDFQSEVIKVNDMYIEHYLTKV